MTITKKIEQGFGNGVNGLYDVTKWINNMPVDAEVTVEDENTTAGTRAVAIQLKDYLGNDMAVRSTIMAYIAADANGDAICETAFDGIANGTDGEVIELTTGQVMWLTSEADGDIDITISETEARTGYLMLVMPNGELKGGDDVSLT